MPEARRGGKAGDRVTMMREIPVFRSGDRVDVESRSEQGVQASGRRSQAKARQAGVVGMADGGRRTADEFRGSLVNQSVAEIVGTVS